jgi:hypothetical protein
MAIKVTKVDVWAGEMEDRAGSLDRILGVLTQAGVNLEGVIARRTAEKPGWGHVYLTPVKGKKAEAAAMAAGMMPVSKTATLRVEMPNKAGTGHVVMGAIAAAGVNVRGITAVAAGTTSVAYIGFDSAEDAARAAVAMKKAGVAKKAGAGKKAGKKR